MRIRRTAREWALQFLFQSEFNPAPTLEEGFTHFWEERDGEARAEEEKARRMGRPEPKPAEKKQAAKEVRKARRFAEETVRGVLEHWEEIDRCLGKHCEHWAVDRMGVVDRNVMRIAAYEMMFREDIPPVVSINEAVDLAKMYSSVESGRFVNGVLDRVRKELPRDARVGADRRNAGGDAANSPTRPEAGSPPGGGAKEESSTSTDATSCVPPAQAGEEAED